MAIKAKVRPAGALNSAQLAAIQRDGFVSVPRLIDDATVAELRVYYDKILARELNCGADDRQLGGVTRQVMAPSKYILYFKANPALHSGLRIAAQVFGAEAELFFDMLIYKPAGHAKSTPWHIDQAYAQMPFAAAGSHFDNNSLQFWVALDDVDVENGCMHFMPGRHHAPLAEHYIYSGDVNYEGRLLATRAFGDPELANGGIACPLKAGGCTVHMIGTPHYTPPNVSKTRGRRAYIFNLRKRAQAGGK